MGKKAAGIAIVAGSALLVMAGLWHSPSESTGVPDTTAVSNAAVTYDDVTPSATIQATVTDANTVAALSNESPRINAESANSGSSGIAQPAVHQAKNESPMTTVIDRGSDDERTRGAVDRATRATAQAKMSGQVAQLAMAGGDQPVDLIVSYDDHPELFDDAYIESLGGELVRSYEHFAARAIRLPASALVDLAINERVDWLSLDDQVSAASVASRAAANLPHGAEPNAAFSGIGIGIAIVDSGVSRHDDLPYDVVQYDLTNGRFPQPMIVGGQIADPGINGNDDVFGHGTHVAGIIAGAFIDEAMVRGIARRANLVSLKVLNGDGGGQMSDVMAALDWLLIYGDDLGIRVVNLSLGKRVSESNQTDPLVLAAERLWDAGFVVVAAAGNRGFSGNMTIDSPGNSRKLITVGSLTDAGTGDDFSDDYVSSFSSAGPSVGDLVLKPDLLAPGNRIVAANVGNSRLAIGLSNRYQSGEDGSGYLEMSGTSMAAPMVAATAALMLEKDPTLTPATVKARLMRSARKVSGEPTSTGAGVLDVDAAMNETGQIAGQALSPLMVRDSTTGSIYVEDTAQLWGDSQWGAGYLFDGGFNWAAGYASDDLGAMGSSGFLWTDETVWARGFLWTDETGAENGVWARGFLWTDEGQGGMGARSLMETGEGGKLIVNDDG